MKLFNENGAINDTGTQVLCYIKNQIESLFDSNLISKLSDNQVMLLGSWLHKSIGDAVSHTIALRSMNFITKTNIVAKSETIWEARWDSGGCAGSETLGEIEADNEDEAWQKLDSYKTGEPYNDDNLYIRKKNRS